MVLVETDFLLALASKHDKHHGEAVELLRRVRPLSLSPYSLVELDLLVLSGRLEARVPELYEALEDLVEFYGVRVVTPRPAHLAKAWRLRRDHWLPHFGGLHAAVAVVEGEALVSYDRSYSRVPGLRYAHPRELLGRKAV